MYSHWPWPGGSCSTTSGLSGIPHQLKMNQIQKNFLLEIVEGKVFGFSDVTNGILLLVDGRYVDGSRFIMSLTRTIGPN